MILTYALWVCILAIGFFLGLAVGEETNLESFLKNWQTLIAGVLAIGAALFTVNEMRRIEGMQQRRHEELMKLNLRSDRLKLQRIAGVPRALDDCVSQIQDAQNQLDMLREMPSNSEAGEVIQSLSQPLGSLKTLLGWDQIVDAKPLLNDRAAILLTILPDLIDNASQAMKFWAEIHKDRADSKSNLDRVWNDAINDLRSELISLATHTSDFGKEIRSICAEYE